MNGKFHQYSFATLESFRNTDVFVKPFFEFSVASGKLAASVKVYGHENEASNGVNVGLLRNSLI